MPRAAARDPIYHRRRYAQEVIELCVRWYLTYRLSYRDLSAMMAEREVAVSHTTIMRWVQRYVPEFERRWARLSKPTNSSWRMDETAVSVRGRWNYMRFQGATLAEPYVKLSPHTAPIVRRLSVPKTSQ